jgi:hypothetical protein
MKKLTVLNFVFQAPFFYGNFIKGILFSNPVKSSADNAIEYSESNKSKTLSVVGNLIAAWGSLI